MARGHLRIYLGAAPGVGKTFAMLNEGWRRREPGADVVIGYVETHGRPSTAEQIGDLPRSSRASRSPIAVRRSRRWTSTPSSPSTRPSRWSTSSRTRTSPALARQALAGRRRAARRRHRRHHDAEHPAPRVRERRRRGDHGRQATRDDPRRGRPQGRQIELVDMTPEALRRRMAHGNIYKPEKSTPHSPTTSASAISRRSARSHCSGSPIRSMSARAISGDRMASPTNGRRANASSSR